VSDPTRPFPVVVDDHLALLAVLGLLVLPPEIIGTPTTTYAWQLRLTQALVHGRSTKGVLQRLTSNAGVTPQEALFRINRPDPQRLDVVDPRPFVWEVAALRVEQGANQLAAETIAVSRHLGAAVRVIEGNGQGHLRDQVERASLDFGVWRLREIDGGLTPET
jgi:hypothetical protein